MQLATRLTRRKRRTSRLRVRAGGPEADADDNALPLVSPRRSADGGSRSGTIDIAATIVTLILKYIYKNC